MIKDVLAAVRSRKTFYRDHYRKIIKMLIFAQAVIVLLIIAIVYVRLIQPPPKFYATSNMGGIREIQALDKPNESDTPLFE